MKTVLSLSLVAALSATPALAQMAPTSFGGGGGIKVHSTKGSGTLRDTTAHTTTSNGATVSTSTDKNDGQTPNGGVGEGGEGGENSGEGK